MNNICFLLYYSVAISINVFSANPIAGTIAKNQMKQNAVEICPISKYGESGCCDPIHIRMKKLTTKNQKATFIAGLNWLPLILETSTIGNINKINNEPNIAITPNRLKKKVNI